MHDIEIHWMNFGLTLLIKVTNLFTITYWKKIL